MPIYEYRCQICQYEFEKIIINPSEAITCPECNTNNIQRILSSFAFVGTRSPGDLFNKTGSCSSCLSKNCSSCH